MNALSNQDLIELRKRLFKLARDHYTEYLFKQFSKPLLTPHCTANENSYIQKYNCSFILLFELKLKKFFTIKRCSLVKDSLDFIYYILDSNLSLNIPRRCTRFEQFNHYKFPLGKHHLRDQLNTMKAFQGKLIKHQSKLNSLRKLTNNITMPRKIELIEKSDRTLVDENQFLRGSLTLLMAIFIIFTVLTLFSK